MIRESIFVLVAALAACGGQTQDLGDGGADAAKDAVKDVVAVDIVDTIGCPATPPTGGASCPFTDGFQCEYGDSFWAVCDVVATCSGGKWSVPSTGACPFDDTLCPSNFSDITNGGDCTSQSKSGETCAYAQGQCNCEGFCGGAFDPDAGVTWKCTTPDPSCPWPRPRFGSACSGNASCSYDICCAGSQMTCTDGTWQGNTLMGGCP